MKSSIHAYDVRELLDNWVRFVNWGSTGLARHRDVCVSYEHKFASHNSRFQYEPRPPRAREPRHDDGHLLEKIITDPEFPAVWRNVLKAEYMTQRRQTEDAEQFLQRKAYLAQVSVGRTYWDFLKGAEAYVSRAYCMEKKLPYVVPEPHEGRTDEPGV